VFILYINRRFKGKGEHMKNMVVLYKDDAGDIVCRQLAQKGIDELKAGGDAGEDYWEEGGTILLDQLEDILDKEI
jgi:hypothetical protein